jgi:hypothetical protein
MNPNTIGRKSQKIKFSTALSLRRLNNQKGNRLQNYEQRNLQPEGWPEQIPLI